MSRPIETGSFVVHEAHPEHGLGRVIAIGSFATRVLFARGGLRVFRADDTQRLRSVSTPAAEDVALLESKALALASGQGDMPVADPPKAPKKRVRKAAPGP
ncbi:MAG: hypothetical protein A2138_19070 [Deltaproteobacteria bacterium RBG_16_71_12]|nr:MAG: hypothetical protein A2138_19070 [Deltaproteobacteria bacterium RBG_16_71_12]